MSADPKTIPIEHEYVTDASFPSRAARAYTLFLLSRPPMVLTVIGLLVIGAACLIGGSIFDINAFVAIGAIYVLVPVIFVPMVYQRTRSGNARRVPTGSRIALGLGDDGMRLDGPLGSAQTNYRAYSSVHRSGDFAIMRLLGMRAYSLLPIQLLPGDDFEKLRAAVAAAHKP